MSHKRGEEASKTPKDEQRTPPNLFGRINERFHFDCDVAATDRNALCPTYFTAKDNALLEAWYPIAGRTFFCNPPYSAGQVQKFLEKGFYESLKGATVVFLISCDVSASYYDICMLASEWIALKGRVEFCHEDGTPIKGSAMFGSMCVVFDQAQKVKNRGKTIVTRMDWKE